MHASREWALSILTGKRNPSTRLIDDLLDISRIENGKIQLRKQPLDLGQTIAQAIETVRAEVEGVTTDWKSICHLSRWC